MAVRLVRSISDSPVLNGLLEEHLLTERPLGDVLLFYINRPSVIVGRNQRIEAEVDTDYCLRHGIEIVRRLSGGGTVYHDYGNINYAFIVDKDERPVLDRDFATPIIDALRPLGVEAVSGERKELLVGGYKISGTASHVARTRILFHGTLLHRTDLGALDRALRGDVSKRGRKVASVPSPVMNLATLTGEQETTEHFLGRLTGFFENYYASAGTGAGNGSRAQKKSERVVRAGIGKPAAARLRSGKITGNPKRNKAGQDDPSGNRRRIRTPIFPIWNSRRERSHPSVRTRERRPTVL